MQHGKQEGAGIIPRCQPRTGANNSLETPRVWPPSSAVLHTKSSMVTAGLSKNLSSYMPAPKTAVGLCLFGGTCGF